MFRRLLQQSRPTLSFPQRAMASTKQQQHPIPSASTTSSSSRSTTYHDHAQAPSATQSSSRSTTARDHTQVPSTFRDHTQAPSATQSSKQSVHAKVANRSDAGRYYDPNNPNSKIRDANGFLRLRPTCQNPAMLNEKNRLSRDPLQALFCYQPGNSRVASMSPVEQNQAKLREVIAEEQKRNAPHQVRDYEFPLTGTSSTMSQSVSASAGARNRAHLTTRSQSKVPPS